MTKGVRAGEELKPCGSRAAYRRHMRHGEDPCDECREAENLYKRGGRPKVKRELAPCGTAAAYARHLKRNEQACEPCKRAHARRVRATKKARREAERAVS